MLVSAQLNVPVEGIEVGAPATMIGGSLISSEVLTGILRVACASGENTTEVGFEERL